MTRGNSMGREGGTEYGPTQAVLHVRNVGGISESTLELDAGVNVLVGRNATNRTSHLQAIMAVLGSENVSLKSSADRASVELEIDGDTYSRELVRENGRIRTSGEPLLEDPELADLFAFLLESNEARRAVARDDDLRELIMRPVDTGEIERRIDAARSRREEIDARLAELESLRNELPGLRERAEQYRRDLEAKRDERDQLAMAIDESDADLEELKSERADLEATFDDLKERRTELDDVRYRIETEEDSIESLEAERDTIEAELETLSTSVREISEIGAEIERLQQRKERLDATVDTVNSVVQFNQNVLDQEGAGFGAVLADETDRDGASPTDALLSADRRGLVCWTCGSQVERAAITSTLDDLRDVSDEVMSIRRSIKAELEGLREQKKEIESTQNHRDQLDHQLEQVRQEIAARESTLHDLRDRRESVLAAIEALEAEIEDTNEADYDEVLDLHRQANEVEFEIEQIESSLRETEAEIESIEEDLATEGDLEAEREEITDRLTDLRTTIDRIEQESVESFNEHMDRILDVLEYENIERVWIERTGQDGPSQRANQTRRTFDLHIARSNESGAVYRDSIDHLSESEREVVGLVFALSGYLVHEVYADVPFMLLDSLESLDSERIATLVAYFNEYVGSIVMALLPEDAAALPAEYNRITEIP